MSKGTLPPIFISVLEAGKVLGVGAASIECGLRNGSFPIGWAWCTDSEEKKGQWNYRIPRQAFFEALATGNLMGGEEVPSSKTECRLYKIWSDMKQRCTNPNCKKYALYGGRGIGYAYEWEQFPVFEKWAYDNGYREYLTLDRINPNLGYIPENCRWATYKQQANNTRANHLFTVGGETHTISEWAEIWGTPRSTARNRILKMERKGDALQEPPASA